MAEIDENSHLPPFSHPVPCPFCASSEKELAAAGTIRWDDPAQPKNYRFLRCKNCDLVYLDPCPETPQWLDEYPKYTAGGRAGSFTRQFMRRLLHGVFLGYPSKLPRPFLNLLRGPLKNRWERYQVEHCHTLLPWGGSGAGRLLDVGSAAGDKLIKMQRLGWRAVGVEPSAKAAAEARRHHHLDVRAGTLEDQNFPGAAFDAVSLISVVEHLPNPLSVLQEVFRVLAPGGHALIDVPNFDSHLRSVFDTCWTQYAYPQHLTLFTEKTLRALVQKAGFEVVFLRHHCSLSLYRKSVARAKKIGQLPLGLPEEKHAIERWFETECPPPKGELLLLLARKPEQQNR